MCQTEKKDKKKSEFIVLRVIFLIYVVLLIKGIVFKYSWEELRTIVDGWQKNVIWEGLSTANFHPFKTIRMYILYYDMPGLRSFANLFGNVIVFIPMGLLMPQIFKSAKKIFIFLPQVFLFVVGIEVFQLFSAFGAFDVDDIILNCFGAVIGFVMWYFIYKSDKL